ncbi:MAG: hypothetical protein JSW10_04295 [Pseudomonadota bacterium]|nr:MAG: hypothetical protein JSW10_04295 [Pseudomonadota bacterium]
MEGIALLMLAFAWQIGVKRKMELIAGYNQRTASQVHDKPGLARLIARLCLIHALAAALMPLLTWLWGQDREGLAMLIGGYGGFVVGSVALTALQARDYTHPPGTDSADSARS